MSTQKLPSSNRLVRFIDNHKVLWFVVIPLCLAVGWMIVLLKGC